MRRRCGRPRACLDARRHAVVMACYAAEARATTRTSFGDAAAKPAGGDRRWLWGDTICGLSSTGLVKCWGKNQSGVLGLGDAQSRGGVASQVPSKLPVIELGADRKATAITVSGGSSACALLDNGDVKCWGNNEFGQLGTGGTEDRGDDLGEMGDALKAIPLGAGRKAIAISAGDSHSCAVLDDGSVKCWGSGADGQLGLENPDDVGFPGQFSPIDLKRAAKAVSAASGVTCAVLDNGTFKCWGRPSSCRWQALPI